MLRRRSNALLASSVALLMAAVIGVQLGHSAIAEINPVHFRGALTPPRAIDARAVRPSENAFAQAYGWEQGHAARAYECGGNCDAREARQALATALEPVRVQRAGAPYWRDVTPVSEPGPWAAGETGTPALSVERYMHYPVEQAPIAEPAEAKVPDDEAEPADED